MRVLTYHKSFRQQVWHYCFDKINELENRIKEDQTELEFFKQLQKEQHRCSACNGMGETRHYYDMNESTVEKCKACGGTGDGSE